MDLNYSGLIQDLLSNLELGEVDKDFEDGIQVENICTKLETVLKTRNFWNRFEEKKWCSTNIDYDINLIVNQVRSRKEVRTELGKGRLLIRKLLLNQKLLRAIDYMDINNEGLIALAGKLDEFTWKLDIENCCWLDETWQIPVQLTHLFVPSPELGFSVQFIQNKPVVSQVRVGSVAEEDNKIQVGDVLTHVDGQPLLISDEKENMKRLQTLMNKLRGKPISITVTKAWNSRKKEIFTSILPLLKCLRFDTDRLKRDFLSQHKSNRRVSNKIDDYNPLEDVSDEEIESSTSGYPCLYLGSVNLGSNTIETQVEIGIQTVLSSSQVARVHSSILSVSEKEVRGHPAILRLSELEVKLSRQRSGETVLNIAYPHIASCGRLVSMPKYFCFVAFSPHQGFDYMCHVFYTTKAEIATEILDSIGQGFQRTSYTV